MSKPIVQKLFDGFIFVAEKMNEDPTLFATKHRIHDNSRVAFFIEAIRKDKAGFLPGEKVFYKKRSLVRKWGNK